MSNGTFTLVIDNQTSVYPNDQVFIYVIGLDPNNSNVFAYLNANGTLTDAQPSTSPTNLALSSSGSTSFTVPYITSARIWISLGTALQINFDSNNPPGVIQPSPSNPSDPNINTLWDFAEFNFNSASLFVNTTQVDAFAIPIELNLQGSVASTPVSIVGVDGGGWNAVLAAIKKAGTPFASLYIASNGAFLRVLQPSDGITYGVFPSDYLDTYISDCWTHYKTNTLTMDLSAAGFGTVTGQVDSSNNFNFKDSGGNPVASVPLPTTQQAFACNGPLATGNAEQQAVQNVLAAALNRGVLMTAQQPACDSSKFYQASATNNYSQILHEKFIANLAYGFAYDDQCGYAPAMSNTAPTTLTVTLGDVSP
jgi:hypothetical protein